LQNAVQKGCSPDSQGNSRERSDEWFFAGFVSPKELMAEAGQRILHDRAGSVPNLKNL
jgi:hypothetical protein